MPQRGNLHFVNPHVKLSVLYLLHLRRRFCGCYEIKVASLRLSTSLMRTVIGKIAPGLAGVVDTTTTTVTSTMTLTWATSRASFWERCSSLSSI